MINIRKSSLKCGCIASQKNEDVVGEEVGEDKIEWCDLVVAKG